MGRKMCTMDYETGLVYDKISKNIAKNGQNSYFHKSNTHQNVACMDTGMVYSTYAEAGRAENVDPSNVKKCCMLVRSTVGGKKFIWIDRFPGYYPDLIDIFERQKYQNFDEN